MVVGDDVDIVDDVVDDEGKDDVDDDDKDESMVRSNDMASFIVVGFSPNNLFLPAVCA